MSRFEYNATHFKVTYTLEEEGPHPTIPYDYYDDFCAITVILRGGGSCSVEGNVYDLRQGDMILLSPDEIRSFRFHPIGCHERVSVYFSESLLVPFWEYDLPLMDVFYRRAHGLGNRYSLESDGDARISGVLEEMKTVVREENDALHTAKLHTLILQLLFWVYASFKHDVRSDSTSPRDQIVFEICKYIKNHLEEDLSYQTLQRQLFVSRYQLTEVFSRNMGMPLTEYIIRKRLSRVISLVTAGEGIEAAAYRSGFHAYSHFYKAFLKYYKKSPRDFLKNRSEK